ncbi:unnamed protein product [Paramecium sonneborni]|uniref:ubiquitinyl hydrolase 1 n=1 Tax=Paramecium sonneborni TaxID=65129 RepID=A0A8S1RED1_9CILI|nr:unnamed protein product [Paramecium sonneborni]
MSGTEEGSQDDSDDQQFPKSLANQSLSERLKQQALEVHRMLQQLESEFRDEDCQTYYILSKNWFEKWKLYVGYDNVLKNESVPIQPGQMIPQNYNQDLLEQYVNECFKYSPLSTNPWNLWLKPDLQEGIHYIVISQQLSSYLNQYYRGTPISRNTFGYSSNKQLIVNLLKFNALLIIPSTISQIAQDSITQFDKEYLQVDPNVNLSDYYEIIIQTVPTFRGNYNGVRIWRFHNPNDPHKALFAEIKKQVQDLDITDDLAFNFSGSPIQISCTITFSSLNLTDKDIILIEFQKQYKPWCIRHPTVPLEGKCEGCSNITVLNYPCICKKVSYCTEQCKINDERFHRNKCDPLGSDDEQVKNIQYTPHSVQGLAGLSNLGNTCFMNSGTQCLSNTYQLTQYFLSNQYFDEINEDNPLGTKGLLVRKFGSLIKKLWCGEKNVVTPSSFKKAVGQFQPMFKGFQQHDSSELITFLLDGLHEDLNRVKKKPYVEAKDSNGRPDVEVAKESWQNHLARNQSIIVDLMHGQYKSTLKCPTCQQISITFDPFLTVGLSIPNRKQKSIQVKVIQSVVQIQSRYLSFDGSKKNMPLKDFVQEYVVGEFKIQADSELLYFSIFMNDISDPINPEVEINVVRKNAKRGGYLVVKVLSEDERKIAKDERIYISYVQKAFDSYGHSFKKIIQETTYLIIKKEYSLAQIHLGIFKNLLPIFCDIIKENELDTDEKLREYYEQNIHGKYFNIHSKQNFMVMQKDCIFCNSKNCQECEVNYYSQETYETAQQKEMANRNNQMLKVELLVFWNKSPFQNINAGEIYQYYQSQQYRKQMEEENNNNNENDNNNNNNGKGKMMGKNYTNTFMMDQQVKVTLQECLRFSEQPEQLAEDNAWYCSQCKEHVQAYKSMQIYKASDILIFTLKRFKATHGYFKQKLETFVEFPVNGLDLKEFIINKNKPHENNDIEEEQKGLIYDLYAVSNHFGGMGGGHYTAFAKNQKNQKWYNFDDSQVSELDEDQIISKNAYLLFYKRRTEQEQQQTQTFNTQELN